MKELSNEQITLLRKPLPKEAIGEHPTKSFLSTIKAIYVVERLNEVFGIGKWVQTSEMIENSTKMVVVKSKLSIPEYGIELESYGGNDNADRGDAFKGASTDALTKMCSYLEIGMDVFKGLATPEKKSENKQEDDKPWINDKQVQAVITRIKGGDKGAKDECYKAFKVSKANRELIDKAA